MEEEKNKNEDELDGKVQMSGFKGYLYQAKLLMLFAYECLMENLEFQLGTEILECNKFDDVVLKIKIGDQYQYYLVQAKHRSKASDEIVATDLFTKEDVDFGLVKYVNSWIDMKDSDLFKDGTIKNIIVCTTVNFNLNKNNFGYELSNAIEEIPILGKDPLNIFNTSETGKLHRFNLDVVLPILQPLTKEYNIYRLAKKIVMCLIEAKPIRHEDSSFKKYHFLLADKVINTKTKKFHENFACDKKYVENFSTDEAFSVFRKYVVNEVVFNGYTLENIHEKSEKVFILSKGFGFKKKEKEKLWNTGNLNITNEKFDKVGNLCDHNSTALAKRLKEYLIDKKLISKNDSIFEYYEFLLTNDVFDIKTKRFRSDFIKDYNEGESSPFDNKKYYGLRIFRDVLKNELKLNNIELNSINDFINDETIQLNLSEDFGSVDCSISSQQEWPAETSKLEIEECLEKIVFATNQPDEIKLDKIIIDHIYEEFSYCDLDLIVGYFSTVMIDWMKGSKFKVHSNSTKSDVRFISSDDIRELFKEIKRKIKFEGPTLQYCEKIEEFSICFDDPWQDDMLKSFLKSENKVLNVVSTHPYLNSIKVYISIKNIFNSTGESYIFEKLSSLLKNSQNYVIEGFRSKICDHLLVIENDIKEIDFSCKNSIEKFSLQLIDILKQNDVKKIIIISHSDDYLSACLKTTLSDEKTFQQVQDEKLNFFNLTVESQKKILNVKINFQSFDLPLSSLIDDSSKLFINAEILSKLINNETIVIGKECSNWKSLQGWYIDRVFCQKIELENCVLINSSNYLENYFYTVSQSENICDISISAHDKSQIDQIKKDAYKMSRYGQKSIHTFKIEDNVISINETDGTLPDFSKEFKEKFIRSMKNKIVLIDAEAGMGKTTIFNHMAKMIKHHEPNLWVSQINLVDLSAGLNKIKEKMEKVQKGNDEEFINLPDVILLLLDSLQLKSQFQIDLFKHYLCNNKVVLLFDGFDEISPTYKNITIKIIENLSEKTKIKQIWISTRPYDFILKDLNTKFDVTAYSLEPFTKENQIELLENIWKADIGDKFNKTSFDEYTREMLTIFSERTKDVSTQFLGIALHTMMIAISFKSDFENFHIKGLLKINVEQKENIRRKLNLSTLYGDFLKIKYFDVFCKQKSKICLEEEANKKRAFKDFEKVFFKENRLLSLDSIFDESQLKILLKDKNIRKISKLKSEISNSGECTGIVNQIIDEKPIFVHKTYAEYFVADWFINVFDEDKSKAEEILRFFLTSVLSEEHQIICSFFNSKLNNETIEQMRIYNGKAVIMNECEVGLLNFTVRNGWLKLAKYLVENGVRMDFFEDDGKSVLVQSAEIYCAYEEFIDLYNSMENHDEHFHERLVEVKNVHNMPPIHARNYNNYQCVRALWEKLINNPKIKRHEKESKLDMMIGYMTLARENGILTFFMYHESTKRFLEFFLLENLNSGIAMSHIVEHNPKVVIYLIDVLMDAGIYGPENAVKIQNASQKCLFHIAAEADNDIVLKHLINRIEDHPFVLKNLFATNLNFGCSILHHAIKYGYENNIKILLDLLKSLKIDIDQVLFNHTEGNETFLHNAAERNKADNALSYVLNIMSENREMFEKALHIEYKWKSTPIYLAIRSGHKNNFQVFLNALDRNNIDIDFDTLSTDKCNEGCMNVFHAAVLREDDEVLMCLLNRLKDKPELIKTFLFTKNDDHMTPVLFAAQSCNKNCLKLLMDFLDSSKVDLESIMSISGRENQTLLHFAANRDKNDGVLKYLLGRLSEEPGLLEKYIFAECSEDIDYTPIHQAAYSGNERALEIIFETLDSKKIEYKWIFTNKIRNGSTLFQIAVEKGKSKMLDCIMDRLKDHDDILKKALLSKNNRNYTPFHSAAEENCPKNFYILYDALKKFEIDLKDIFNIVIHNGETLLHLVARRPKDSFLKTSLDYLKDDPETLKNLLKMNESGYTPIYSVIWNDNLNNLQILVDVSKSVGINIEEIFSVLSNKNESIFHVVMKIYHNNILNYLIEQFKDNHELMKKLSLTRTLSNQTAIHYAAYEGHEDNLKILLDALKLDNTEIDALFHIIDDKGKTLLHLAAERKWSFTNLTTLLDLVKDYPEMLKNVLSIKDNENRTPIECAESGYKTNKKILVDVLESLSLSN